MSASGCQHDLAVAATMAAPAASVYRAITQVVGEIRGATGAIPAA